MATTVRPMPFTTLSPRLSKRKIRPFTKEEAIKRDISEIENIAKAGPIAYADYSVINNDDIEKSEERLLEIVGD